MRQKSTRAKDPAEKAVRDIRRRARKQYSAEEKIRIVLAGLRGEDSIAALCRREGIAEDVVRGAAPGMDAACGRDPVTACPGVARRAASTPIGTISY